MKVIKEMNGLNGLTCHFGIYENELIESCYFGEFDEVKKIIKNKSCHINDCDDSAIKHAAGEGHLEIVKFF